MIKIKINDTIVDIVEKIEAQKQGDIVLDFPLWHPILHSYISLKILKSKVKKRKLIIATNDKIGKRIGKKLWIEYSYIKDSSFLEENSQNTLLQHNFTFWEYFKFQVRSYFHELRWYIQTNKKINTLSKYSHMYHEKTSVHIFLSVLLFSFFLFLFIYYFAINKTYVFITPEITVRKEAHNFIFRENTENSILWNNKNIKLDTWSKKIEISETYASTWIKNNKYDISSGKVTLYNAFSEAQSLVPNTRLQSPDGIIFELRDWVQIPAWVVDNFWNTAPWSIEVEVIARLKDEAWNFTGTRGNIQKWVKLLLPGLSEENQKMIYAESLENFSGGRDDYEKMVTQEDIDNATQFFIQKLKNDSLKSLKSDIFAYNNRNNTKLDILPWSKSIYYDTPKIELEEWVEVWSIQHNFSLSGSMNVYAYVYDSESIIQKLKTLINEKRLDGIEKISHIDTSSLRMSELLYFQENPLEIKATFEIEALFQMDFLHTQNTYISTLRSKIRWMEKDEAEKILLNDPKISNVEIKIRPFFIDTVSNIYNNIIFELEK